MEEHEVTPTWREDTPEFVCIPKYPHRTYTSDRSLLEISNSSKWYTPMKWPSFWVLHSSRLTVSYSHVLLYSITLMGDKVCKWETTVSRRTRLFICGIGALGVASSLVACLFV